ncbi:Asp-tRNA(Asn)/Glu-tRNA(Gln) amidotransferase GatCAB subunit B [Candidatus Woesearchaeota archaeon]|nr:Asp-tRNA(Asn)/Glu-tRNA(Gln) amidotransferase GatCAB subunit B [Candidatus Woesearchaeota archaeon]
MKFTTDIVIGLEIHAELDTQTKLFCSCATKGNQQPNTRCCPICLGHPGTRPVLNKKALDYATKLCLALGSKLTKEIVFSRKNYFYPDMSKNYQITQFEEPIGTGGTITLKTGRKIQLTRIHIEEDPAALAYTHGMKNSDSVLVDYNRAGNPLVEIVTEPQLTSPAEARDFLNRLISVLGYLNIFDITRGIIKADANISLKESNYSRVEIKNISGFKEIEKALTYEITRQKTQLRRGLKITRETRGWNPTSKTTLSLRTKETEADYGYILEPDLSLITLTDELIHLMKKEIPELAQQKSERYQREHKLSKEDADVMSMELELAQLFEKVATKIDPKLAARWLRRELLRVLNYNKKTTKEIQFNEKEIIELLSLVQTNTISETTAQKLMEQLMEKPFSPKEHIKKHNLEQVTNEKEIETLCKETIKEHPQAVKDYHAGEQKSLHYLLGQIMKKTRGKAEPTKTTKILKKELKKKEL